MSKNEELTKLLLDQDEYQDVESQGTKKSPAIVTGVVVDTTPSPKKVTARAVTGRRRGCPCWCKCICIFMTILGLFAVIGVGVAYYSLKEVVGELTIETPQKFPVVNVSDEELEALEDRVEFFVDRVREGRTKDLDDLVLTQDELNGAIGHSDYLRGNFMVTLHENRYLEEFSLPMSQFGFGDRYFVGNDYLTLGENNDGQEKKNIVEMKMETAATHEDWFNGPLYFVQLQYLITKNKEDEGQTVLEMFLEQGSFFGQAISQQFIDKRMDLLEGLYDLEDDDEDAKAIIAVIDGIESVTIEEGKVTIKARQTE